VLIQINDDPPAAASYGIPRPDVARNLPQYRDAGQSGFRFFWDTSRLPEGPCTVRITAISRSGQSLEAVCHVRIEWKTPSDYALWISRHEPTAEELRKLRLEAAHFATRPLISIAAPVYRTSPALLKRCIESVMEQVYPNWQLCLADDGSRDAALTALLGQYARSDSRIRVTALPDNRGISAATNAALCLATGDYVAFLDHDDELAPFALWAVVEEINQSPDIELFYSDEDKIDEQGRRYDAFFKPGWSPDLFRSCNYVCHFIVIKRSLLERAGGLNERYNGAQDYEFLLRVSELQPKVRRIPKILYHWRALAGSAAKSSSEKPAASADGQRALEAYLERHAPGARVEQVGVCRYRVHYPISGNPRVSILIPTGGHKNVFRAMDEVLEKTTYRNYDILLIDNSRSSAVAQHVAGMCAQKAPIQYMDWRGQPFNFAAMNNAAARAAASPYVLFLNDDTSILTRDWLEAMLEHAQHPEVGAVGAQLWYPNNLIQHAGVVMGMFGNCSHAFKGLPGGLRHYYDLSNLIRNCSAVTGACLLVSRDKFFQAGGFDEVNLAVAFQDVDLCLKLLELGYRNVYTPYALLYHYESATKTEKDKIPAADEDAFMKRKWARYIADDPYYNPNLARMREDFSLQID
jgi:O-antigen biosynthesis protein